MKREILRIPEISEGIKVILLNISKSYNAKPGEDPIYIRENVYEMTRKYWKLNKEKANLADYTLGVANGKVVSVYKNTQWENIEFNGSMDERCGFVGEEVKNSPFLGLDLSLYMRCQNPVRYVNY